MFKCLLRIGVVCLLFITTACSTTYSHFGRFYAENSLGEPREFLLEWESTEYSGLITPDDYGSNVRLSTQCSTRVLTFSDSEDETVPPCSLPADVVSALANDRKAGKIDSAEDNGGSGTLLCGQPGKDLAMDGRPVNSASALCGYITGEQGQTEVQAFGRKVRLNIQCYPAETSRAEGDEKINTDYLKASTVPYTVTVKKVVKGSGDDRPPVMTERVCGS